MCCWAAINTAETAAEAVHLRTKNVLPHLARLFLVATYIDDVFRLFSQWSYQRDHMDYTWGCGYAAASLFILINIFLQAYGSVMILSRCRVKLACSVLGVSISMQLIAYCSYKDIRQSLRVLALIGSLALLFAERISEERTVLPGLPKFGDRRRKACLQLVGRVLVLLLLLTLPPDDSTPVRMFMEGAAFIMTFFVTFGYKTRLSALVLSLWLFAQNWYFHPFWRFTREASIRDELKYDFFITLSIVGGLLMIVAAGPGDMSIDERKKLY